MAAVPVSLMHHSGLQIPTQMMSQMLPACSLNSSMLSMNVPSVAITGSLRLGICAKKNLIELLNNNSHGLSPPGGSVSPSGGFSSLLCDQGLHFASIKLCLALSRQGAKIKIPVVRCHYLLCLGPQLTSKHFEEWICLLIRHQRPISIVQLDKEVIEKWTKMWKILNVPQVRQKFCITFNLFKFLVFDNFASI